MNFHVDILIFNHEEIAIAHRLMVVDIRAWSIGSVASFSHMVDNEVNDMHESSLYDLISIRVQQTVQNHPSRDQHVYLLPH